MIVARENVGIRLKIFRRVLMPPAGDQADVTPCRPGNPVLDGATVTLVVYPFQTVATFPYTDLQFRILSFQLFLFTCSHFKIVAEPHAFG